MARASAVDCETIRSVYIYGRAPAEAVCGATAIPSPAQIEPDSVINAIDTPQRTVYRQGEQHRSRQCIALFGTGEEDSKELLRIRGEISTDLCDASVAAEQFLRGWVVGPGYPVCRYGIVSSRLVPWRPKWRRFAANWKMPHMLEQTANQNQSEASFEVHRPMVPSMRARETDLAVDAPSQTGAARTDNLVTRTLSELRAYSSQGKSFTNWMFLTMAAWAIHDAIENYGDTVSKESRVFNVVDMSIPSGQLQWLHDRMVHDIRVAVIVCAGALCLEGLSQLRKSTKRRKAMDLLAKLKDQRSLGPMIDAVRHDPATRKPALEGLTAILSQLGPNDGSLLGRYHRKELNVLLRTDSADPSMIELQCAILCAYQNVGDAAALKIATELAYSEGKVAAEVRCAAISCLPALNALVGQRHRCNELLRPSDCYSAAAASLVRPASLTVPADTTELLRAGYDVRVD